MPRVVVGDSVDERLAEPSPVIDGEYLDSDGVFATTVLLRDNDTTRRTGVMLSDADFVMDRPALAVPLLSTSRQNAPLIPWVSR